MKRILHIGTGGTIAAILSDEGYVPGITSKELISQVPAIQSMCETDSIQVCNLDSTNITPEHWIDIAKAVRKNYDLYDGFVITHGTDTMAYTAAGLSYLIQSSPKPIVITGAQQPYGSAQTDVSRNITDAFFYACSDESAGVRIVFSGRVIAGTRGRKNYTRSFAAFDSVNFPSVAEVHSNKIIRFIHDDIYVTPIFADGLNTNVGLIKLVPGLSDKIFDYIINHYDGLIIESFGTGGLPEYSDYFNLIKKAAQNGKLIVMTTQVPNEGSDLTVYKPGSVVKTSLHILEAHDMTSEAALAKLMWILKKTKDFDKARKMFYTNIDNDILYI